MLTLDRKGWLSKYSRPPIARPEVKTCEPPQALRLRVTVLGEESGSKFPPRALEVLRHERFRIVPKFICFCESRELTWTKWPLSTFLGQWSRKLRMVEKANFHVSTLSSGWKMLRSFIMRVRRDNGRLLLVSSPMALHLTQGGQVGSELLARVFGTSQRCSPAQL